MARFIARFDSGSGGWDVGFAAGMISETFSGSFDRLRIGANTTVGTQLRNGLINSRSAVSTDIYEELDSINRNGASGSFFPSSEIVVTSGQLTGSVYTSSVDGIKTPVTNDYGVVASVTINYSKRPTGSILISQNTLIGPTNPLDSASVNYNVYLSASQAVRAVLDVAQTGNGTLVSPYTRLGNRESRTLHSIWHDPDLQYFAWDDFTPGLPQNISLNRPSTTDWYWTNNFNYTLNWGPAYQFLNDKQALPRVAMWFYTSSEGSPAAGQGTAYQSTGKVNLNQGVTSYTFTINPSSPGLPSDGPYKVDYELNFRDAKLVAIGESANSEGPLATATGVGEMTLYRLYGPFTVKQYNGTGDVNLCASYTGTNTSVYSEQNWASVPVAVGNKVYTSTDTVTPGALTNSPNGKYRITVAGFASVDYVFDMGETSGVISAIVTTGCT